MAPGVVVGDGGGSGLGRNGGCISQAGGVGSEGASGGIVEHAPTASVETRISALRRRLTDISGHLSGNRSGDDLACGAGDLKVTGQLIDFSLQGDAAPSLGELARGLLCLPRPGAIVSALGVDAAEHGQHQHTDRNRAPQGQQLEQ